MRRSLVTVLLPVVLVMAACSGNDGGPSPSATLSSAVPPPATLEGMTWVLNADSMTALSASAPADARIDITFEGGTARGLSACNSYSGSFTLDGGSLSFGQMASTAMACVGGLNELESAYLAALGQVSSFAVEGDTLTLSGGGTDLVFTAEEPASLTATAWTATMIGNPNALTGVLEGVQPPTATFADDGTVSGSDGCNQFNGGYSLDGDSIQIGPLAGTKMACESQDVSQQAADFTAAMEGAATFELGGTSLTLFGEDGRILVEFTSAQA